jgi:hypothetical protein
MGPGLALRLQPDPAQGLSLDLVAKIMFGSGPDSSLVQIIAIKHYKEHFGLSQAILFFHKEKIIHSCTHLMLMTVPTSPDFDSGQGT